MSWSAEYQWGQISKRRRTEGHKTTLTDTPWLWRRFPGHIQKHHQPKKIGQSSCERKPARKQPDPKPVYIAQVVKRAVKDQRDEETDRDERKKNIIIYSVPERTEKTHPERKQKEKETVNDILKAVSVETEHMKIVRLGKYKQPGDGQNTQHRPINVVLDSHEIQQEVMDNTPRLKDADDHIKSVFIAYDMTQEERQKTKEMVLLAKEKRDEDPNYEFKIRGPPGKMIEQKKFQKRKQKQPKPERRKTEFKQMPETGSIRGGTPEP